MNRQFPVLRGYVRRAPGSVEPRMSVPWAMLTPHEEQARKNHGQTLERLAERRGLSPSEILWIIRGQRWEMKEIPHAEQQLEEAVAAFEAANK